MLDRNDEKEILSFNKIPKVWTTKNNLVDYWKKKGQMEDKQLVKPDDTQTLTNTECDSIHAKKYSNRFGWDDFIGFLNMSKLQVNDCPRDDLATDG